MINPAKGTGEHSYPHSYVEDFKRAERLAYAEAPYRDVAAYAASLGLVDEARRILNSASKSSRDIRAYGEAETETQPVSNEFSLKGLGPQFSYRLEKAEGPFQNLSIMREYARVNTVVTPPLDTVNIEGVSLASSKVATSAIESGFKNFDTRVVLADDEEVMRVLYDKKVWSTLDTLRAATGFRVRIDPTFMSNSYDRYSGKVDSFRLDTYVRRFAPDVAKATVNLSSALGYYVEQGLIDQTTAAHIFSRFDLARYGVKDLSVIMEKVHDNSDLVEEELDSLRPLNTTVLTQRTQAEQRALDKQRRRAEVIEAHANVGAAPEVPQKTENAVQLRKNKLLKTLSEKVPTIGDFFEENNLTEGVEITLPDMSAVEEIVELITLELAEEALQQTGRPIMPLRGFDLNQLWRTYYAMPKGYYGGGTGGVTLKTYPATEARRAKARRAGSRFPAGSQCISLDITVEAVKRGLVEFTSTMKALVHPRHDASIQGHSYTVVPIDSKFEADTERILQEHEAHKQRGRALAAMAMLRPLEGGAANPR
jgi:hypothetical protein